MKSRPGRLGEDGPQLVTEPPTATHENADARGDTELTKGLDLGCGGDHGRIRRQQHEPGIVRAEDPSGHPDPEKPGCTFGENLERTGQAIDERSAEASDLADQAQQFRPTSSETEHCPDHGIEPFPLPFRTRQTGVDGLGKLTGHGQQHGVEKPVLGAVVVEKGLLGTTGGGGDGVE